MTSSIPATLALEGAIARHPLTISPWARVGDAIALMSASRMACLLTREADNLETPTETPTPSQTPTSCVLVVDDDQRMVGIVTERDLVRLSVTQTALAERAIADIMTHPVITMAIADLTDIFGPLMVFHRHHIRHLPIVEAQGQVVGLLTPANLQHLLQPIDLLRLRLVAEVMSPQVVCAAPTASLTDLARCMTQHRVGAVLIVTTRRTRPEAEPQPIATGVHDPTGSPGAAPLTPVGLVTESDLVQCLGLGLDGRHIPAAAVMRQPVGSVPPDATLEAVEQLMQTQQTHQVVVTNVEGDVQGVVTTTSLLKIFNPIELYQRVNQLEQRVSHLESETLHLRRDRAEEVECQVQVRTAELHVQAEREKLLATISAQIRASLELDDILNATVSQVRAFLGCDRVIICQNPPDGPARVVVESVNTHHRTIVPSVASELAPRQPALRSGTALQGRLWAVEDVTTGSFSADEEAWLAHCQVRAYLMTTILQGAEVWGVLMAHDCTQPRHWLASELELLQRISDQVAIALQQALAYQQAQTDLAERRRAEAALQQSEAQNRAILSAIPDLMFRVGADGVYRGYVSNRYVQDLLPDPMQAIGQSMRALLPTDLFERQQFYMQRALDTDELQIYEQQLQIGDRLQYEEVRVVKSAEDEVLFMIRDITGRKQTEAALHALNQELERRVEERTAALQYSEARYRAIVEDQTELICRFLPDSTILYVNEAYCRFFGIHQEDVIGRSYTPILFEDDQDYVTQMVSSLSVYQPIVVLENRVVVAGEVRWTQWTNRAFFDDQGQIVELQSVGQDITKRKQAEAQLHEANQQLLHANAELARATRLKDEFLASMSHELRTPLNAILGLSEGLQEDVYGPMSDRQHQAIATIERSGRHLLELINDILDLSKIESGKLELDITSVPLKRLCDSSLAFIKQQAIQKNIHLTTTLQANVRAIAVDERRMRQVLINLLNNAVKFTPSGGQIAVDVVVKPAHPYPSPAPRPTTPAASPDWLCISVTDTGIGIAATDLDSLFEPFVQLDSRLNRQYTGTGLGLTLVKQITELHGGWVTVESALGQGSCFTVCLPYTNGTTGPSTQSLPVGAGGSLQLNNDRVLVVEDSTSAAEQIARYLSELGMEAMIHPRGEGTLEQVLHLQPALIILDILLPNQSGWETLQQLKTHPDTKEIPVLVISVVDERSRGLALGAADYLVKPIAREQFQSTLEKLRRPGAEPSPVLIVVADPPTDAPLILLAEDNPANIDTLSNYLESRGYRLVVATHGQEAIDLASRHIPDLIVMDIQMPGIDGLEAIRQIRTHPALVHTPILALTALAMPYDRDRCLEAGATDYLAKPVKLKQLAATIQQLLDQL